MSETADDTDSRTVPDGVDGESDYSYFQTLEEAFIRLRGAPLLLSPADWHMAKEWRQRGIPVELIERVLGEVLEERRSRPGADHIVTLRYFRRPVENAWNALGAVRASGLRGEAEALDVASRLGQLAEALPSEWQGSEALGREILALEGNPEQIEKALTQLEDDLLARLEKDLGEGEKDEIDGIIDRTLGSLGGHVEAAELETTRRRLKREAVRRRHALPVLSLFAVRD